MYLTKESQNVNFLKLKEEGKYFDLRLIVKDSIDKTEIDIHKCLVCPISEFLNGLVAFNKESSWPPVHTLEITLPEHITCEDFKSAINIIYGLELETVTNGLIHALNYLLVPDHIIITTLQSVISIKQALNADHLELLGYMFHDRSNYVRWYHLLEFYGTELLNHLISTSPLIDDIIPITPIFGRDISDGWLKTRYDNSTRRRWLPQYIDAVESSWIHINQLKYEPVEFTLLGINWSLNRHVHGFDYGDDEDIVHLYVHSKDTTEQCLSMRAYFIIYDETSNPKLEIFHVNNLNTSKYKLTYMKRNYEQNMLTFTAPFGNKRVRVSVLLERLQ